MKRLLLFAAALCCVSLWSCDNDQEPEILTPAELEIEGLNELISTQQRIDEEALVEDLLKGTMQISSIYYFWSNSGKYVYPKDIMIDGGRMSDKMTVLFMNDNTCRRCLDASVNLSDPSRPFEDRHLEYDWRYDSATRSIITHNTGYLITYEGEYKYYDECSAKVLYYNADNHRLILEGDMFNHTDLYIERMLMSGYIDVDPTTREQALEKYSYKYNWTEPK